jgi:hypothetical protein
LAQQVFAEQKLIQPLQPQHFKAVALTASAICVQSL